MAGDEYFSSKGSLKLKGITDGKIKKKKKKNKDKPPEINIQRENKHESLQPNAPKISKTKAELKFEERRRKKEAERIYKKASKTHKEKVEDFNRHLDTLTEHFDIPKVSWTK